MLKQPKWMQVVTWIVIINHSYLHSHRHHQYNASFLFCVTKFPSYASMEVRPIWWRRPTSIYAFARDNAFGLAADTRSGANNRTTGNTRHWPCYLLICVLAGHASAAKWALSCESAVPQFPKSVPIPMESGRHNEANQSSRAGSKRCRSSNFLRIMKNEHFKNPIACTRVTLQSTVRPDRYTER